MGIIIAEAVIFSILFTVMGFAATGKKSRLQVHNYPPEIQEECFKTHERIEVRPLSGRVIAIKAVGILIFTVILAVCACVAGAEKFAEGFGIAFGTDKGNCGMDQKQRNERGRIKWICN